MAVSAVVGVAAVVGAGASIYSANKAEKAATSKAKTSYYTSAEKAKLEAISLKKTAGAEAEAVVAQAEAEASAYSAQADLERDQIYQAAEEARNIAYENIDKMKSEAEESLRRLEGEQETYEAKARAKAGASGVRREGSTELYLEGMEDENDTQYNWLTGSYQSGIDVATKTAETEYSISKRTGDAAVEAGKIKANAALSAAGTEAKKIQLAGIYSAQALDSVAASYTAAAGRL